MKSEPVIALDIFPTALAAAGIGRSPEKPIDGTDLLPLMTGKVEALPQRTLYWKTGSPWAVRDGDLKLVAGNSDQQAGEIQLFDLSKDIGETKNLAKERPDEVKRLQSLYQTWAATHQPTPWGCGAKAKR